MDNYLQDQNPKPNCTDPSSWKFQLQEFLMLDPNEKIELDSWFQSMMMSSEEAQDHLANGDNIGDQARRRSTRVGKTTSNNTTIECKEIVKKSKMEGGGNGGGGHKRVAFRTKSELEIMDDGFKWRKYGKKSVKNSPNPRNYFKCSNGECSVKKRVERDRDDPSYVITTYDGLHNHHSPFYSSPYYYS